MNRRFALILAMLAPLTLPIVASEGRIPIFEALTLDASQGPVGGKYVVTRNISVTSGSVIKIIGNGEGHVEIDLNGFTLEAASGAADVIDVTGLRTLTIRNGVVRHLGSNRTNVLVKNTGRAIVENLKISNGRFGVFLDTGVKSFAIRKNAIENTGDTGILVNFTNDPGALEVAEGSIVNNSIRDAGTSAVLPNGGRGIEVRFGVSSVVIQDNRIERPKSYGLTVNSRGAVVISGNRINETGYRGIIASRTSACRISNNVVRDAGVLMDADQNRGGDGIFINETASNCLVVDNVSTHNWMSGLRVEGLRSHIERNVLNSNTKAGLHFEETSIGNTYGRNTARDNATNNGNPVGACQAFGCSTPASRDVCDEGSANTSFGDNLAPGPPPC